MLALFPGGFEEVERAGDVELAAYTDAVGEERLWHVFGTARAADVEDGWEDRWRSFHRPVRVGPVWVGPPWEEPPAETIPVLIDPGRAFGTGTHPTTRLCLELLLALERGSLLDVGSGSGVLAIAAARLGFRPVIALDDDPPAVEATRANALANGVELDVRQADALAGPALPRTDVAVANIGCGAVASLAPVLGCDRVVTSGYLSSDEPVLAGFRRLERRGEEGWAADLFARVPP